MIVLDSGDSIRGIAEVATKFDYILNGYVGVVATQLADGQLGSSEADLYLSGANGIVVTSITIVNTDSVARTFTLYLKPSGGTSRAISPISLDLGIGYSFHTDGQRVVVMDASGNTVSTATVLSHALGGSSHDADTLANLNGKISDATLVDASAISSEIDGDISTHAGLADPHTGYLLASGTRALAGAWNMSNQLITNLKLGGALDANANVISGLAQISGTIGDAHLIISGRRTAANAGVGIYVQTYNNVDADTNRLTISSGVATAVADWQNITHTGLKLGGSFELNGQAFDAGGGQAQINTTGSNVGLIIISIQDGAQGAMITLRHTTANPANADRMGKIDFTGNDVGGTLNTWGTYEMYIIDVTEDAENIGHRWWGTIAGDAGNNILMTLSGAGILDVVKYKVNGVAGANFSGVVSSITVVDGLVTSVT